jgi:D-alanyl-lipoteichoic acid acyltransferase DltB (MBOAT superfamily)
MGYLHFLQFGETWWYRHLAAAGAVMNVNMMMVANLVGFAIGLDGVKFLLSEIIATWHGKSPIESSLGPNIVLMSVSNR